jgi:potassium-transporting ATPase KdpC subunit
MIKAIGTSLRIFLFLTVLTGVIYPLAVTGVAELLFPFKANGSILTVNGKPAGSLLIGQSFDTSDIYFRSRPSAVSYNPLPSGGSNFGMTNRKLHSQVAERLENFRNDNRVANPGWVPSEMLFASASGLDPHISPAAALLQVERISRTRNFTEQQTAQLKDLVYTLTEPPQFLCLGQERINVLLLNLETDKIR